MACELEEAFDAVLEALPADWRIASMTQDGAGWLSVVENPMGLNSLSARAGTLTRSLKRLAEKLENHGRV